MLSEEFRRNPLYLALRDSALITITPYEIDPSIGYFILPAGPERRISNARGSTGWPTTGALQARA